MMAAREMKGAGENTGPLGLIAAGLLVLPVACFGCSCRFIIPEDWLYEENDYGYVGHIVEVAAVPGETAADRCKVAATLEVEERLLGRPPTPATVIVEHACLDAEGPRIIGGCDHLAAPKVGARLRVFGRNAEPDLWTDLCTQTITWERPD